MKLLFFQSHIFTEFGNKNSCIAQFAFPFSFGQLIKKKVQVNCQKKVTPTLKLVFF